MQLKLTLKYVFAVLLTAVIAQQSNAQSANGKSKFLGNIIASSTPSNFNTYWNQVTPENGGKWGTVQGGGQSSWNWSQCDVAYNYANSRGYNFKFHTLVWGAQYPSWVTSLSSSAQKTAIQNWMNAVKNRYSNIWAIDVVNEPVKTACPFKNALGGDGNTGWDWVITAFQMARSTFPGKKLLINEYGTENDAGARGTMKTIINHLIMEIDISMGGLGKSVNVGYMAPMWRETLMADTYAKGEGSTVAKVIEGSLHNYKVSGMVGVANIYLDENWTGNIFGQANWYTLGRLAWDYNITSEQIADEWIRMTFSNDDKIIKPIKKIMMDSREHIVNYMDPLGLNMLMG